jgi:hypothetical protein
LPQDRTDIIPVYADYAVTYILSTVKKLFLLYEHLAYDREASLVIRSMHEPLPMGEFSSSVCQRSFPSRFIPVRYVTFVTGDIGQTYIQIAQIRIPMFGKHNLKGINIQFTGKFLTDGTYNLIIDYQTGKSNQNTAEQLEVDIPVEMFRQVAV